MKSAERYLWNGFHYRLNLLNTEARVPVHWLFLPGGPGIGSEYYHDMALNLKLPGITWLVDFPGDGSNRFEEKMSWEIWTKGLINLIQTLYPCVLVTHSFSGMFALSIPELENYLNGLIIMNSSPNHSWYTQRQETLKKVNPDIDLIRKAYLDDKNDITFKNLSLASVDLFFTEDEKSKGKSLIENLPYNATYYDWVQSNFHPFYSYKWIPKKIPTMIIGAENDILCPLSLFQKEQAFIRPNIEIHSISKAGHFPWINTFTELKTLFDDYIKNKLIIQLHG